MPTQAHPGDLPAVLSLLRESGLPLAGVEDHFEGFFVARDEAGRVVGCVGLETHGSAGLLRSLAVMKEARGTGIGRKLVEHLLRTARAKGIQNLYLLTTTAEDYFPRFGFEPLPRNEADPQLEGSEELQGACPESAVLMRSKL